MNIREPVKWQFFKGLNLLSDFVSPPEAKTPRAVPPAQPAPNGACIWVFCSTIGEFNACKPLLDRLVSKGPVVFLTDHACYTETYQQRYPGTAVVELTGRISDGPFLARRFPPDVVVVCEIPAKPNEAPCRLSYGVLRAARQAGARVYLVNTWLYGYEAACRMDELERRWFTRHYLELFDHITAQSPEVKDALVAAGVETGRISIAGNMKFDALKADMASPPPPSEPDFQTFIAERGGPLLVAGCLAGLQESGNLISVLGELKLELPALFIVLAPRHPENRDFMKTFLQQIEDAGLSWQLKSRANGNFSRACDVLVLDTFGELKKYYAMADVCYVGCNHNILEPLSYAKPTVISGQWDPTFPSYPVYRLAREREVVHEERDAAGLQRRLRKLLSNDAAKAEASHIRQSLDDLSGAVDIIYYTLDLSTNGKQQR